MTAITKRSVGLTPSAFCLVLCALVFPLFFSAAAYGQQTGNSSPASPPAPASTAPAPSPGAPALPPGAAIFSQHCAICHGAMGEGRTAQVNIVAPSLQAEHNRGMVMKAVLTGPSHMPSFARTLSLKDIKTVSAFVSERIASIPLTGGDLNEGGKLFRSYCAPCHRTAARGGALAFVGANAPSLAHKSPALIAGTIRSGAGPMPSFPASQITDQQLASIVDYVTYIQHPPNPGGTPIGYYGPVAEGFFVWLGVLALILLAFWIEKGGKG